MSTPEPRTPSPALFLDPTPSPPDLDGLKARRAALGEEVKALKAEYLAKVESKAPDQREFYDGVYQPKKREFEAAKAEFDKVASEREYRLLEAAKKRSDEKWRAEQREKKEREEKARKVEEAKAKAAEAEKKAAEAKSVKEGKKRARENSVSSRFLRKVR